MHSYTEVDVAVLRERGVGFGKAPRASMAHRRASTALPNSASTLSPAVLAIRPPWFAISPSRISRRSVRASRVATSSAPRGGYNLNVSRENSSQSTLRFDGLGQGVPRCLRFPCAYVDTLGVIGSTTRN
jgi:hypothetical protein